MLFRSPLMFQDTNLIFTLNSPPILSHTPPKLFLQHQRYFNLHSPLTPISPLPIVITYLLSNPITLHCSYHLYPYQFYIAPITITIHNPSLHTYPILCDTSSLPTIQSIDTHQQHPPPPKINSSSSLPNSPHISDYLPVSP